ncbi:hypothetical protein [Hornefia butyriciproducens]|uniref:hypothetical protein n=1 Tax=Hornefia butyriciproducens TaxID=2652293 RepID=UPI003F89B661
MPETIEKALDPGYKPPYYRNAFLCNAMVNMYMIDTNSIVDAHGSAVHAEWFLAE